jgi:competence protein ComEC
MFLRPLIPILFSFAGGIAVSYSLPFEGYGAGLSLFLLVVALSALIFFLPSHLRQPAVFPLFVFFGMFLGQHSQPSSNLADLAASRARFTIIGTVLAPPSEGEQRARIALRVEEILGLEGEERGRGEKIMVTVFNPAGEHFAGQRILFPARLRPFRNFNNPGSHNYARAMKMSGFACAASVSDGRRIVPMGRGGLGFPMDQIEGFRKPLRDFFKERLSPHHVPLLRALILGEKQGIGPELRASFNRAGLGHVLVVSGLHVALVAWFAFAVLVRLLSLSYRLALFLDIRRLAAALACFPVLAYACLAGFGVSCQRATIMVIVFLLSVILGKEKETWSTLAIAGLAVLAVEPASLFSISFQLSFLAVTGILWLGPPLRKLLSFPAGGTERRPALLNRLYLYFADLTSVTVAATVFLLPLTVFYFHRFSWTVVPANLTVLPLLGLVVLPFGLVGTALFPVSTSLAEVFLRAGAWGLDRMMDYVLFWGSWSWSEAWVIAPNSLEVLLLYGVMFFAFFALRFGWARRGLVVVLLLLAANIGYWVHRNFYDSRLKVTFLDVGQGNAALIQFPGRERMLIDGGGFSGGHFDVGERVVGPFLLRAKITRIDYLVLSHPDTDHMDGLRFIASHFRPREFWHSGEKAELPAHRELMETLRLKKVPMFSPGLWKEDRTIGGVAVSVLHPEGGDQRRGLRLNDRSLVVKLTYQGKSFLFPGDLERGGEERAVLRAGRALKSDVLLAPHHGSKTSCSQRFLDHVKPRVCVISTGPGNPFSFPNVEVVERLERLGCVVFRTDRDGAVEVVIGRDGGVVRPFLRKNQKGTAPSGPFMF